MKNFKTPKWDNDALGDKTYDLVAKANLSQNLKKKTEKRKKYLKKRNEIDNALKSSDINDVVVKSVKVKKKHVNADKNVVKDVGNVIRSQKNISKQNKKEVKGLGLNKVKADKSTPKKTKNSGDKTKNINSNESEASKKFAKNNDKNLGKNRKNAKILPLKITFNTEDDEPLIINSTESKTTEIPRKNKIKIEKLRKVLQVNPREVIEVKKSNKGGNDLSLRDRMLKKLKSAQFRFINEQIYTTESKDAVKLFKEDERAFKIYHEGYRQQVQKWPLNPVDTIINSIKKMGKNVIVADFGCGEAKLAASVAQKVFSFDLVATNDSVTVCDMSKVPLEDASVDVVVCCLSLMGTNLADYIFEANRVLKAGGVLKIAEVESRFDPIDDFIKGVSKFGFKKTWQDLSHNLFYFIDFKKTVNVKNRNKLPTISLHPCLYKKR